MATLIRLLLLPFYRIQCAGRERVKRGSLLLASHVATLDALIVCAALGRVKCFVHEPFAGGFFKRLALKLLGATVIPGDAGPDGIRAAADAAIACVEQGQSVCLFTRSVLRASGSVLDVERLLERNTRAPVHALILAGPWGSAHHRGAALYWNLFLRKGRRHVVVVAGEAMAPGVTRKELQEATSGPEYEAWMLRKHGMQPLDFSIVHGCRRNRFGFAFADPVRGAVKWFKALTGAIALARALAGKWGAQQRVGLLLPPSIAGALVNMAAVLGGRTVVNLNYTTGRAGMESACAQADLKSVVTSKTFLHKARIEAPAGLDVIELEDIARSIGGGSRIVALALAMLAPLWLIRRMVGAVRRWQLDDTVAVIFSSGSTGEPKGIEVSHFNMLSNIEGAEAAIHLGAHDRILHMLPFFHTFGNLLLWLGVHLQAALVFLPNPLDAEAVGDMTEGYGATIVVATPTFMQMYMKRLVPGKFGSVRLVVAGAEKLNGKFAEAFKAHFGVGIHEGYGCTECSPVISCNTPDIRAPGVQQAGLKPGTVGRPFPGVLTRVVDPDTREPLPQGQAGLMQVKGPNVMKGYLGKPEKTAEVLQDGWYSTGDIVKVDEDGHLVITDRLSRFSKIGGEMVPHCKIEDALHLVIEASEQVFAVTAVRDDKKGERIAVVHVKLSVGVEVLVTRLMENGLPNIFVPKARDFIEVEALPVLGTGKMDLRAVRTIAQQALAPETATA
ncbi:MAG: AMP-binding protein [Planctomycetes bacterium]|nr:AMP-binding protein [Planctomycetota bacterium]